MATTTAPSTGARQIFDYKSVSSFTKRYLETYYQDIDPDELEIAKFLVREYKKIEGEPEMLEIGCGPTVHHSLPVVPYISSLDMADYLPENMEQIDHWKNRNEEGHNWNHFSKKILELEGNRPSMNDIKEREDLLRQKINHLNECDVLQENPVGNDKKYPVVGFFYCAEEVAIEKGIWQSVISNVCDLVLPGGRFYLACLNETDYYTIVSDSGEEEKLPTCNVCVQDFEELMPELGFDMDETVIELANTPSQIHQGINGVILVSAKKAI